MGRWAFVGIGSGSDRLRARGARSVEVCSKEKMVPRRGLEPPRGYPHQHLKLARYQFRHLGNPKRTPAWGPAPRGEELYERTRPLSTRGPRGRRWGRRRFGGQDTGRGRSASRRIRGSARSLPDAGGDDGDRVVAVALVVIDPDP